MTRRVTARFARRRAGRLKRRLGRSFMVLGWSLALLASLAMLDGLQATGPVAPGPDIASEELVRLSAELDATRGELTVKQLEVDRLKLVARYSALYKVPANLAATIYDASIAEEIHPSLGFQLVKVESGFRPRVRSSANALGLAQVQLRTARMFDSTLTERELMRPKTNLRMGFRVLRRLLHQFDYDLELALRAYNLGPTGAVASLSDTSDTPPGAKYARSVMRGVKRALVRKG